MKPHTDRPPHPLAIAVANSNLDAPALLVGIGNGRNLPVLLESGRLIFAVDESETLISSFASHENCSLAFGHIANSQLPIPDASVGVILATHALQHGTWHDLTAMIYEFARVCRAGAEAAMVFASIADARFGKGIRIESQCYASSKGEEQGVAHIFLTEAQIRTLLGTAFIIHSLEHVDADTTVGSWAHQSAQGLRHFFVRAYRKSVSAG